MSGMGSGIEGGRGSRRPHLIVMVGLPARGKTYIAKKLARSRFKVIFSFSTCPAPILCLNLWKQQLSGYYFG